MNIGPYTEWMETQKLTNTQNMTKEQILTQEFEQTFNTTPKWFNLPKPYYSPMIITDNPATMLAHYFIKDFKDFDIFKNNVPDSSIIIEHYTNNY